MFSNKLTALALLLFATGAQAQVPMTGAGKGTPGSGGAAYVGPGDVAGAAVAHWGAQAYTAAYASSGGKAFNVCLASDTACGDLVFDATGAVVDSSIGGSFCSAVTCTIKIMYDHVGNSYNDITQATEANRPTILFNCQNGHACIAFAAGQKLTRNTWNNSVSVSQPWTINTVYKDTGTSSVSEGAVLVTDTAISGASGLFAGGIGANQLDLYAGTSSVFATTADNAFHSISAVGNAGSSSAVVDGSTTTGTTGTRILDSFFIGFGNDVIASAQFIGRMGRAGVWSGAISGGNSSTISANDHTFWGF